MRSRLAASRSGSLTLVSTSERPRWPWPGDTPTDRARRIANSLLVQLAPDQQREAIVAARAVGETWLGADLLRFEADDIVTTEQAAQLVHVSPAMIRKWHSRGLLERAGDQPGRYRVGAVLGCAAQLRRTREQRPAA